eukprot:IDg14367t1
MRTCVLYCTIQSFFSNALRNARLRYGAADDECGVEYVDAYADCRYERDARLNSEVCESITDGGVHRISLRNTKHSVRLSGLQAPEIRSGRKWQEHIADIFNNKIIDMRAKLATAIGHPFSRLVMPPLHENDSSSSPTLASVPATSKRIAAATQLDATAPVPVTPPVRADVAAVVPLHREVVLVAPLSHADRGTPRVSARRDAGNAASSPFGRGAAVAARVAIRTAIYFAYDGVGAARKEGARVAKAILELLLDEAAPPPARREMSIARKVVECVAPPAASSLACITARSTTTRALATSRRSRTGHRRPRTQCIIRGSVCTAARSRAARARASTTASRSR